MMNGVPMLPLDQEMRDALGVEVGDDVEVSVSDRMLIIRAASEVERKAKMDRIFAQLLVERDSAYRRLAEGVK